MDWKIIKENIKHIIPEWFWNLGHLLFAVLGATVYAFPSRDMIVIGVTGTNGKSTVIELIHYILRDFGFRVASHSSIRTKIGGERDDNTRKMTMPGRFVMQKFLHTARKRGCQIAVLEVTSEGIKQYRHIGIQFDIAVFTNLKPEHIESHGSFENYRAAKGRLFAALERQKKRGVPSTSVINVDDPSAFYYAHFYADQEYGYGLHKENVRKGMTAVIPEKVQFKKGTTVFSLNGEEWESGLVGDFNVYNVLAALAVARVLGVSDESAQRTIKRVTKIPGRLETIQEKPFRVIVDYAHTPDALESVYRLSRTLWVGANSRLIVVLGSAGGGRDRWKRPEIGKIADRFADHIILTNEDPYDEDPERIIAEIRSGITETPHETVIDRKKAIARALEEADEGDTVVLTGKGTEKMIMTKSGPVSWDERRTVRALLRKRKRQGKNGSLTTKK